MAIKAGKEYELLIEKIYKELEPNAEIKQDDYIMGEETGTLRQIDLSIRSKIADTDILIIVQAKDYKRKADVNTIGTFISVIRDVRAQKGIIIGNSGFTKKAIDYAKKERIELYSAHTALQKRWELEFQIPVIQTLYKYEFAYDIMFAVTPGEILTTQKNFTLSEDNGITTMGLLEFLTTLYKGKSLDFSGKSITHKFENPNLKVFINNEWREVAEIMMQYKFEKVAKYLNYYKPIDYRGLKDYLKDKFKATFINFDGLKSILQNENWEVVKSKTEVPINTSYIDLTYFEYEGEAFIHYNYSNKP